MDTTGITKLFATELPIIQAPMAGVQGSTLTLAVSNAGGLGSLPCAVLNTDSMREELTRIKAQTAKPYNVNFFCHTPPVANAEKELVWQELLSPYYIEMGVEARQISSPTVRKPFTHETLEVLKEFEPPVVSFHFGLPAKEMLAPLRSWGAKIISTATTIDEALWLEANGVDAIIAQGVEAGGHRGMFLTSDVSTQTSTSELLTAVIKAVNVPVIAAGGIADAIGVKATMALGATAVQVGTAYLLCPEASTSQLHRAALLSDSARETALTNLFSGRPARSIMNRLMTELGPMNKSVPEFPLAGTALAPLRAKAEKEGAWDFTPLWSGQSNKDCKEIPAAELTFALVSQLT